MSFSASGKRGGFSDKRHLWPTWFRLIRELRPQHVFGEQTSGKDGLAWLDLVSSDLEGIGYTFGAADIPDCGFGAPHKRNRVYFVADSKKCGSQELCQRNSEPLSRCGSMAQGDDTARCGSATGPMADPNGGTKQRSKPQSIEWTIPKADGRVLALADAERSRRGGRRAGEAGAESKEIERPSGFCATGALGDTARRGFGMRGSAPGKCGRVAQPGEPHELGDTAEPGFEIGSHPKDGSGIVGQERPTAGNPGFTNGFWSDAEWLLCRPEPKYPEGRWRAVEPGTFPLATGTPNRVGRLRGYGNALCAPVAQAFIEAYLEVCRERSKKVSENASTGG
jgi:DNA (cytosine-5)-methyltransferase 1